MSQDFDDIMHNWHEVADSVSANVDFQWSEEALASVVKALTLARQESDFPSRPEDMSRFVIDLRNNEREWSGRLADVILHAQELQSKGERTRALDAFLSFERACPWVPFVEIAKVQRQNTLE